MPKPVSLADVARHAGTSPSAASRALNGRLGVRAEIREAVLRSAEALGYSPNPAARKLVLGRTSTVAMVIDDRDVVVGTEFFAELVSSLITTVEKAGLLTVLFLPESPQGRRDLIHVIRRERIEGVVVIGHRTGDDLIRLLHEHRVPLVCLGRPIDGPPTTYVDVDNIGGAQLAVEHLLETGRRRIGLLTALPGTAWGADRRKGYEEALELSGLSPEPDWIEVCSFDDRGGYDGMSDLLQRCPDLDAVFCTSEALLRGALRALGENERRIPEDIALVTFDDGPTQAYGAPPTTAVRQPLAAIGRELGTSLVKMIADDAPVHHLVVSATLHVRHSSAPPQGDTPAEHSAGDGSQRPPVAT